MKLSSTFLRLSIIIVLIALFSRVQVTHSLRNNNDSKHGYCSFLDLRRSVLLVKQNVQKKKNGMFRIFRKNTWTIRFPEVNNFGLILLAFFCLFSKIRFMSKQTINKYFTLSFEFSMEILRRPLNALLSMTMG